LGWVTNLTLVIPPYSFPSFLTSTAIPLLLYALPIPVAAIWLLPRKSRV
jgi:hypothetical protein